MYCMYTHELVSIGNFVTILLKSSAPYRPGTRPRNERGKPVLVVPTGESLVTIDYPVQLLERESGDNRLTRTIT